jgi:hypothetical protein
VHVAITLRVPVHNDCTRLIIKAERTLEAICNREPLLGM